MAKLGEVRPFGRAVPVMSADDHAERARLLADRLDVEKIHGCMLLLNWQWRDGGVPSSDRIWEKARDLIYRSLRDNCCYSTGGLVVPKESNGCVHIVFQLDKAWEQVDEDGPHEEKGYFAMGRIGQ